MIHYSNSFLLNSRMLFKNPQTLQGTSILLEPIDHSHFESLYNAAQYPEIWNFIPTNGIGENFNYWFEAAIKAKNQEQQFPYVVRRHYDQKIIGTTRFYDIDMAHCKISIGYTWYIPETWGTNINPESKYLMLKHAFESLNVNRVQLKTDSRNKHSQAAIRKLGAKEEGTLRQDMLLQNGIIRDTVLFSIIKSEWPEVKTNLELRLG
ncbi:GNAT family N-acetyltransferase [Legionella sp. 27fs60]|nr:GNAT family N-acetyltransferase [Legionella bononiensis]